MPETTFFIKTVFKIRYWLVFFSEKLLNLAVKTVATVGTVLPSN